jgi:hypothetical protein
MIRLNAMVNLLAITLLLYGMLGIWVYFGADALIFQPPPASYQDSSAILKLKSQTGATISAVYLPNPSSRYTLLFSHGNAEDLGQLVPLFQVLQNQGFAVFAYDYQGYGTSQGRPSEQNTYQDIEAAYTYLTQTLKMPADRIIAHGRSVGSGPTVKLAAQHPLAGVILESAFISTFRVVIPWPLFPFDKFPNLAKIQHLRSPLLVIHGTADQVVPFWHGQTLYQQSPEPKQHFWVEGAGHNDLIAVAGDRYFQTLQVFAQQLAKR